MKFTKTYNKILFLLSKEQKNKSVILISLMFLATFAEIFSIGLIIVILNFFLNINNNIIFNFNIYLVNFFDFSKEELFLLSMKFFFLVFIIKTIALIFVSWFEANFHASFKESLSNKLFFNFLNRDSLILLRKNSSEYLRNFTSEIDQTGIFFNSLLKLVLDLIVVIVLFLFLVFFNPAISISILLIFLFATSIYFILVKNILLKWGKKSFLSKNKRIQVISESFLAIKYIKILSREKFFFKRFKIENYILSLITKRVHFLNALPKHVFEFLLLLSIFLLIFFLFSNSYEYKEIVKIISVYIVTSFRLVPSLNRILGNLQSIRFGYSSFLKIYDEINIPIIKKKEISEKISFSKNFRIVIKKFFFKEKNNFKLKNISIEVKKFNKIGFIGPSGSGKSTLINIICGFLKPDKGDLYVDGVSVYKNLVSWQKIIGYIPQNIIILNDTLRSNILFGLNNNIYSDNEIIKIIKKVNLYNFYLKLPNGLNQMISQNGLNISGGEIQRIGIARALINNPEVIILDESTSALDTFTENKILKEINSLKKTIIFVSHRLNTLKFCNKIYTIKNNSIKRFK